MRNINLNLLLKMKKLLISAAMMLAMMTANAENLKVTSPDGRLSALRRQVMAPLAESVRDRIRCRRQDPDYRRHRVVLY